jgi:hypothetical protein
MNVAKLPETFTATQAILGFHRERRGIAPLSKKEFLVRDIIAAKAEQITWQR